MRILIHDRPGYPFPVQLSRELARRGYQVLHSYGTFFQSPKGALTRTAADPANFNIAGIELNKPFQKYSFLKRVFQEIAYSRLLISQIQAFCPDVAIFADTPSDAQAIVYRKCRSWGVKRIFWVQDLYGIAVHQILGKKAPLLGNLVGHCYIRLDQHLLRQSDEVVLITEDFQTILDKWGIERSKTHVVPNWAPITDLPVRPKANPWARALGVADKFCILYAGTLGMKHNPGLLLQLAQHFKENESIRVVVVSEGLGAEWLKERKQEQGVENLLLTGYQPFSQLPDVLGSADILVAILEPEAGIFSVPSKVLSYLCAQRPVLLAVPPENLAARIVSKSKAGLVVHPADEDAFVAAADTLVQSAGLRQQYAANAFAYAVEHFDINRIGDRFERIITNEDSPTGC